MPVKFMLHYTRKNIRDNPDQLFVFGDNFERSGYGGQAREARDEPNAVGIPTKHKPSYADDAYLSDADLEWWTVMTADAWSRLFDHLHDGGTVIWPVDGIGTGRAKLDEKAPAIVKAIELYLSRMKEKA